MSSLMAQRLPSRNKSFQSAEILTVTELCQKILTLSESNASVRVTGTLVSHNIDGQFIRISDPLLPQQMTNVADTDTNANATTKMETPVNSPGIPKLSSSKRKSNVEINGINRKKRCILSLEEKDEYNIVSETKRGSNMNLSYKPFVIRNSIIVDVSYVHTASVKIGDLVLVIGEMQLVTPYLKPNDDEITIQLQKEALIPTNSVKDKTDKIQLTTIRKGGYLQARILQNVNGTNMNLMHQALMMRRKYSLPFQSISNKENESNIPITTDK